MSFQSLISISLLCLLKRVVKLKQYFLKPEFSYQRFGSVAQ